MSGQGGGGLPLRRRHATAARVAFIASGVIAVASGVLLKADRHLAVVWVLTFAAAVVCALACQAYLRRGQQ